MAKKSASTKRHLGPRRLRVEKLQSRSLLAADLLLTGIEAPPDSELNHAAMSLVDLRDNEVSPVASASLLPQSLADSTTEGISGLAILRDGRVATAVDAQSPASSSELLIRSSLEQPVSSRFDIRMGGQSLAIADLAADPLTGDLYGVTVSTSATSGFSQLVRIDPGSGQATLVGETTLLGEVSIAIDADQNLYATTQDNGFAALKVHTLDLTTAQTLSTFAVMDQTPFGFTTGLAVQPDTGLLYGSESHLGRFFTIDPSTRTREFLDTQPPLRGVSGDLAFVTRRDSDDVRQLFHADFNEDTDDFTINNSLGQFGGLWDRSVGRRADGLLNHSLNGSFYYGRFETAEGGGHTILDFNHHGVISSPTVEIPESGTSILSFSYLLDTRPELTRDFVTVSIDDGTTTTAVLSRTDGTLPETSGDWVTATVDLSAFAGQVISVDFEYESGDPVRVDPEGWYVDDVIIVHLQDPPPLSVDLGIAKTTSTSEFSPQSNVSYTLRATNGVSAEGTARGVQVIDTLPQHVEFVSAGDGGVYDPNNRTVTWSDLTLDPGEGRDLSLLVSVDETADGQAWDCDDTLANLATIQSAHPDTDPANDSFTLTSPIACTDLSVVKTSDPLEAKPGQQVTYTIEANNQTDTDATGVLITDTLPQGVTLVSATNPPPFTEVELPTGETQVQWTLDGLAANESTTFTIVVMIDEPAVESVATLTNTVVIDSDQPDDDVTDNTSTTDVTRLIREVDLSIVKTSDTDTVAPGELLTYTIDVTNLESSDKTSSLVTVTDTLPDGVTLVEEGTTPGYMFEEPNKVIWTIDSLTTNTTETFQLVVRVDEAEDPNTTCDHGATFVNMVTAFSSDQDPEILNNTAEVTNTISCPVADLSVSKTASDLEAMPGDELLYTIVVQHTDQSNVDATGITITDQLPDGVTLIENGTTPGFTLAQGGELVWSLPALPIGDTAEFEVLVTIDDIASDTITVAINTVTVTGDQPDPEAGNDSDSVSTTLIPPRVDLQVNKTVSDLEAMPGNELLYTIVVQHTDQSNVDATGITITDQLPDGVTLIEDGTTPGFTLAQGGELVWSLPTLPIGDTAEFEVLVTIDDIASDTITVATNTATVTGDQPDPEDGNDSDSVSTTLIPPRVDLQLTKTADVTNPSPGDLLTYTLTVQNNDGPTSPIRGFGTAENVSLTDTLPDGVTFVSANPAPSDITGTQFQWDLGSIAGGETRTVQVAVLVNQNTGGLQLTNAASVDADETDSDTSSNSQSVTTVPLQTVQFISPLSIFRDASLAGAGPEVVDIPTTGAISGYLWTDDNRNGVWDASEIASAGVDVFLDLNGNGQADLVPGQGIEVEPLTTTDINGRYVFADLADGDYLVRTVAGDRDDGPFLIPSFPSGFDLPEVIDNGSLTRVPEPVARGHEVTLSGDSVIAEQGATVAPNFGASFESPMVRPADQFTAVADNPRYLSAIGSYQQFSFANNQTEPIRIVEIEKQFATEFHDYVHLYEVINGELQPITNSSFPREVPATERLDLVAIYDPAIRAEDTDPGVTIQSPEWRGTRSDVHQFSASDRLVLKTEDVSDSSQTLDYPVALVGGSTFDSDIDYNAEVNAADTARLQTFIDQGGGQVTNLDAAFDRTSDINARCPNGASQIVNTCSWEFDGTEPLREISLGDYGPLNVELGSQRPVILDLDTNNDAGGNADAALAGLGYTTAVGPDAYLDGSDPDSLVDGAMIVDDDAFFAGFSGRQLSEFTVELISDDSGDQLRYDGSTALSISPDATSSATRLVFINQSITELEYAIRQIRFVAQSQPMGMPRVVEVRFDSTELATPVTTRLQLMPA